MTNSTKITLALGLLSILAACGSDGDDDKVKDAGPIIPIIPIADSGVPVTPLTDSGTPVTPTTDGGTPVTPTDSGAPVTPGDCFNGVPVKTEDFLNRCTTAATATKTLAVPAALLNADGTVKPL